MVVESLVLVQHGYASQAEGARNYGSGRDRYIKVVRETPHIAPRRPTSRCRSCPIEITGVISLQSAWLTR
jgi:hypothetical protein